jgi:phosphoglycolate phosphatase
MRDSFPELFGNRWEQAGKFYQQSYRSIHLTHLTPLPGAEAMLAAIPRPQVSVGVVSNKQAVTLRQEVPQLGWDKYFGVAIGATDAAHDKPHADPGATRTGAPWHYARCGCLVRGRYDS